MSDRANELVQAVLALSQEERDEVVRRLWESERIDVPDYLEEMDEEEHAELQRRLESLANGTADPVPFDEAMVRMREELERRRVERMNRP